MSQIAGPALIFDGDCAFCTTSAHRLAERWSGSAKAVAGQQLGTDGLQSVGLTPADVARAAYWVDGQGRVSRGHAAVARALMAGRGRGGAAAGRLMLVPPVSWLARPAYWLVARNRHRLPGATDACRL